MRAKKKYPVKENEAKIMQELDALAPRATL